MKKYRITSIPQSLPKAQMGFNKTAFDDSTKLYKWSIDNESFFDKLAENKGLLGGSEKWEEKGVTSDQTINDAWDRLTKLNSVEPKPIRKKYANLLDEHGVPRNASVKIYKAPTPKTLKKPKKYTERELLDLLSDTDKHDTPWAIDDDELYNSAIKLYNKALGNTDHPLRKPVQKKKLPELTVSANKSDVIYVTDPNDPRLKEYKEKTHLYNLSKNHYLNNLKDEQKKWIEKHKESIEFWKKQDPSQIKKLEDLIKEHKKNIANYSGSDYRKHYRRQKGSYKVGDDLFDDVLAGKYETGKPYEGLDWGNELDDESLRILKEGLKLGYKPQLNNIAEGYVSVDYIRPRMVKYAAPNEEAPKETINSTPKTLKKPKVTLPEGYSYRQDDTRDGDMNDYFFTNKNGSKKRISREEFIEATGYAPVQFRERHVEIPDFKDGGQLPKAQDGEETEPNMVHRNANWAAKVRAGLGPEYANYNDEQIREIYDQGNVMSSFGEDFVAPELDEVTITSETDKERRDAYLDNAAKYFAENQHSFMDRTGDFLQTVADYTINPIIDGVEYIAENPGETFKSTTGTLGSDITSIRGLSRAIGSGLRGEEVSQKDKDILTSWYHRRDEDKTGLPLVKDIWGNEAYSNMEGIHHLINALPAASISKLGTTGLNQITKKIANNISKKRYTNASKNAKFFDDFERNVGDVYNKGPEATWYDDVATTADDVAYTPRRLKAQPGESSIKRFDASKSLEKELKEQYKDVQKITDSEIKDYMRIHGLKEPLPETIRRIRNVADPFEYRKASEKALNDALDFNERWAYKNKAEYDKAENAVYSLNKEINTNDREYLDLTRNNSEQQEFESILRKVKLDTKGLKYDLSPDKQFQQEREMIRQAMIGSADIDGTVPKKIEEAANRYLSYINNNKNLLKAKKEYQDLSSSLIDPDFKSKVEEIEKITGRTGSRFASIPDMRSRSKLMYPNENDPAFQALSKKNKDYIKENWNRIAGVRLDEATVTKGGTFNVEKYLVTPEQKVKLDNANPLKTVPEPVGPEDAEVIKVIESNFSDLDQIYEVGLHEGGHDMQLFKDWISSLQTYRPEYGYDVNKAVALKEMGLSQPSDPINKLIGEVMVEPKLVKPKPGKKPKSSYETWLSSIQELHSEMQTARGKIARQWMKEDPSLTLDAVVSHIKNLEKKGNNALFEWYFSDAMEAGKLIDGNLSKHFKKDAPWDKIKKLLMYMPAVGVLTTKALNNEEKEFGGEIDIEYIKKMEGLLDNGLANLNNMNLNLDEKMKSKKLLYDTYNRSVPAKFKKGGSILSSELQQYKDYISGTNTSEKAVKNYDKLNRVYYKEAKGKNMSSPNYIMTQLTS